MSTTSIRLACVMLLGMSMAMASRADSLASSASSAGSASLGSLSDSIHNSSNSSSPDKKVAEGDYQVIEIAALPDHPGMLRLKMQRPAAAPGSNESEFFLDLPQKALGDQGLATGDTVTARYRPYGIEFARATTRETFFLVLTDDWRRELDPRAVTL